MSIERRGNGLVSLAFDVFTGLFSTASSVDVEWFSTMSGVGENCVCNAAVADIEGQCSLDNISQAGPFFPQR